MPPNLATLAVEVTELIASHLEPAGLCSLRLACRSLNEMCFRCFGAKLFATVKTDLSSKSLQRLHRIAGTKHLAQYVKAFGVEKPHHDHPQYQYDPDLYSNPDTTPHGCKDTDLGEGFEWPRSRSEVIIKPHIAFDVLQDALMNKFINCRSFYIKSFEDHELYHDTDLIQADDVIGFLLSIFNHGEMIIESFSVVCKGWSHDMKTNRIQ